MDVKAIKVEGQWFALEDHNTGIAFHIDVSFTLGAQCDNCGDNRFQVVSPYDVDCLECGQTYRIFTVDDEDANFDAES